MNRIVSLALTLAMCFVLCVPAMALEDEQEACGSEMTLYVSDEEDMISDDYKVTSILNNDGTYTIRGYKEQLVVEEYVVMPGSGSYIKRTLADGVVGSETIVTEKTAKSIDSSNSVNRAGYLGTMYYQNIPMNLTYMIRCTIENSTTVGSHWPVQSFAGTVAEWTAKLVAMLGVPAGIASGCAQSFLVSAAFYVVSNEIHNKTSMDLQATVISHTITGTSTSPLDSSYHEGTLYGETATITAPGTAYEGYTYKTGYSSEDWGDNAFGRAMFKAVYNSDWTPTGWTD